MTWSEDKMKKLVELVESNLSASRIAEAMGTTRSAIIGKIMRSGLQLARRSSQRYLPHELYRISLRNKKRHKVKSLPPRPTLRSEDDPHVSSDSVETTDLPQETAETTCSILELTVSTCRWPVGPGLFCGRGGCDVTLGRPYCREHSRRARRTIRSQ